METIYCGETDSIDHTLINCHFTKSFSKKVLQSFNLTNNSSFTLTTEDIFFGLINTLHNNIQATISVFCLAENTSIYPKKCRKVKLPVQNLKLVVQNMKLAVQKGEIVND